MAQLLCVPVAGMCTSGRHNFGQKLMGKSVIQWLVCTPECPKSRSNFGQKLMGIRVTQGLVCTGGWDVYKEQKQLRAEVDGEKCDSVTSV